jgi:hypothetical protein
MFEEKKQYKKLDQRHKAALAQGLPGIGAHVKADTENLIAGNEEMVCDDPALVTGPQGIDSGEWDLKSFGWLVLTNKRLNFMRIDGDRVRVAFLDDLTLDNSDGPFDTYKWQDRAQLRLISFGFLKGATTRAELAARSKH